MKEEKKYKTAEAVMNAQDAGIAAAKKNYDDLLTTEGAWTVSSDGVAKTPNLKTKAAHEAWEKAVNDAAAQRQAFAVPEKGTKQPGTKKKKTADEGAPVAGFGASLKQFFERNPHIVPELAIIGMKSQLTPYGQMAPEDTQRKQQYDAAQRDELKQQARSAEEATVRQYAGKSRAELQAAPASLGGQKAGFKNALEEYNNALMALNPPKPTPESKPGTVGAYLDKKARELGVDVSELTGEQQLKYEAEFQESKRKEDFKNEAIASALKASGIDKSDPKYASAVKFYADWFKQPEETISTTSSGSTVDENGNRHTESQTTRGTKPLNPEDYNLPKNFPIPKEDGGSQQGASPSTPRSTSRGFRPPAAPGAGRGNLAAGFPTQGGGVTPMRTKSDLALEKAVSDEYGKADTHFNEELDKIDQAAHQANNPLSPAEVKTRTDRVTQAYNDEKARITRARVSQIEAAGEDPWKRKSKDDKGNEIGTMDDVSWKNTRTGYDVPAPSGGPQAQPSPQAQALAQQAGGKPQQMTPAPQQGATSQQGATHPQPEAGNPPATPPKPRTIEQLRDERNKKKVMGGLYRYSGAEGMADYYGAIGRGISSVVGFDKKVVGAVGHVLSTYLNGEPGDVNDYEINGSPVKTTAKDAQEFHDSGFAVREKYNVNGVDHFLTPEEAEQARKAGYKITSSKKHHGPA
jgi:hypothetical protein